MKHGELSHVYLSGPFYLKTLKIRVKMACYTLKIRV